MLQAQSLPRNAIQAPPPFAFKGDPVVPASGVHAEPKITVTFSTVTLDGSNLWRENYEAAIGQIMEAIRLADLRARTELLITDIAPWIETIENCATDVAEAQEEIEEIIKQACRRLKCPMPEARLSVRSGSFEIRCYLGREKPTDYAFKDDEINESR